MYHNCLYLNISNIFNWYWYEITYFKCAQLLAYNIFISILYLTSTTVIGRKSLIKKIREIDTTHINLNFFFTLMCRDSVILLLHLLNFIFKFKKNGLSIKQAMLFSQMYRFITCQLKASRYNQLNVKFAFWRVINNLRIHLSTSWWL